MCLLLVLIGVVCGGELGFDEWTRQHGKVYSNWKERIYREVGDICLCVCVVFSRFQGFSRFNNNYSSTVAGRHNIQ